MQRQGAQLGNHICSDRSETKVCDPRLAGGVHKDILLAGVNTVEKLEIEITTHSIELTMNHVAGMEVTEAPSDVGQLITRVSV